MDAAARRRPDGCGEISLAPDSQREGQPSSLLSASAVRTRAGTSRSGRLQPARGVSVIVPCRELPGQCELAWSIWPRISPPGKSPGPVFVSPAPSFVCTFTYVRPARIASRRGMSSPTLAARHV